MRSKVDWAIALTIVAAVGYLLGHIIVATAH